MDTPRTVYAVSTDKPGSEVAGETAAALAAASIVFRSADPAYSGRLMQNAIKAFEFADNYRGAYSDDPGLRVGVCPFYCDFGGYQVRDSQTCYLPSRPIKLLGLLYVCGSDSAM